MITQTVQINKKYRKVHEKIKIIMSNPNYVTVELKSID